MDVYIMYFHQNSRSGRISLSGHPVHEMNDFIMRMRHIYIF
jgi:hypothetical protein